MKEDQMDENKDIVKFGEGLREGMGMTVDEALGRKPVAALVSNYAADIPLSLAIAAHAGSSFTPEKRGAQEIEGYVRALAADFESLSALADTDEKKVQLDEEFARYREGYRKRFVARLQAASRCMSTMIAGPANFPVSRMEKRNAAEQKRSEEQVEFRERALDAIRKALRPELRPIMSGDADAVERLKAEIAEAEAEQARMKAENTIYRKGGMAALVEAGAVKAEDAEETERNIRAWWDKKPHTSATLTNNNASIKRLKDRLARVERDKAKPAVEITGPSGIRVEDAPADNRVRLFFPDKPDAAVRDRLNHGGYRWAPTLGCWQAYRNHGTIALAREITGIGARKAEEKPAPVAYSVDNLPPGGARVQRKELRSHHGTVVSSHPAGVSCETCNGSPAHVKVKWDDGPQMINGRLVDVFDEDPENLEALG